MPAAGKDRKTALYEDLKQAILTLELRPGGDLDEVSLSNEYELSRTPLREVFRQLAGEGYVYLSQNRGARVSNMSHQTLRDFFLVAPMIYSAVLKLAAENATPDQIQRLKKAQERFKAAVQSGDVKERTLANTEFHAITGEMSDNVYLQPSFHRLLIDHARIGMTFYRPNNQLISKSLGKASDQHDAIIASIEAGDSEAAGKLANDHWNLSRGQIESFVLPSGLEAPLGSAISARS